jgi:hypothetical protein
VLDAIVLFFVMLRDAYGSHWQPYRRVLIDELNIIFGDR